MFAMRLLIYVFLAFSLFATEEIAKAEPLAQTPSSPSPAPSPENPTNGYTINYNTVSILEYLKFASKICKVNFIYDETDLNFTVTIVSDEPATSENVMATLLQVLRIHGLQLLEQDGNLVIHKSDTVKQIATLVTDFTKDGKSPIVTRIFRVKNANVDSVAAVIRPMISSTSILETSPETRQLILTDITANVSKVAALIEILDSPHTLLEIKSFDVKNNNPAFLVELASQIMNPVAQGNPFILVPQPLANAIFIVSTPELVERAIVVFESLDVPPKKELLHERRMKGEEVFLYKVTTRSGEDILRGLLNIGSNLQNSGNPDPDLLDTLQSAKWIKETNSIMIMGSKSSIDKTKEFLSALDVTGMGGLSFFVYKPTNRTAEEIEKAILEMAKNLRHSRGTEEGFVQTIESVTINPTTQTLMFSGEEKHFARIRDMLNSIDAGMGKKSAVKYNFYLYTIQHTDPVVLQNSLKNFAKSIDKTNAADSDLISTINSLKYIKENNSILFTGPDTTLKQLETLVPTFDTGFGQIPPSNQFLIYKPINLSGEQISSSLKGILANLKADRLSDPGLIHSLDSMKWEKKTNSLMFTGDGASLKKVEDLIATIDIEKSGPNYFMYKVQNTTGDIIEEDLDAFAKNLKATGLKDIHIIDVIHNVRYVKETNSLLLSGAPEAIEEVKKLIVQYDYPRTAPCSNFLMYKPLHLTANQIQKSLYEVARNLRDANLADPTLLATINSSKYVESTNSLIFTGCPDTLSKLQTLLNDIDSLSNQQGGIQKVGKTSFLLHKLKHASGPQFAIAIKSMAADMKKTNGDKELVNALNSIRFVKETNSVFFTGTDDALIKVQTIIDQFDIEGFAGAPLAPAPPVTNFFVYRPQSVPGPDLEKILIEFAENARRSGLMDPDLFNAVGSMRWTESTGTILFTGTPKGLEQVKGLLTEFDIPANAPGGLATALEHSIQAIDNVSFLVYKLQFHKGDEIQSALRQISRDLLENNAPVNKGLLNSINSIQWLEVTNSLLASGDQDTLTRLRELIKNLDIPLKQVFIEVLVIETTLTNALSFGLEWGGNVKYRNKFAGTTSNTIPPAAGASYAPQAPFVSLPSVSPTNTPNVPMLPASGTGQFDLGVIGEVIRHKGNTFISLASLLKALQQDTETTVIDTPKILTQDGRTSTIFVGRNIPFVGSFVQNSQNSGTIQSTNIEYRDIGLNMIITPVLGNSDIVTLDIQLERSQTLTDITQESFSSGTTANGIVTSKTNMETTVHVPDDHFLILSGTINNSNSKVKAGIPCLGGLPLVGAAFSQSNDVISNTNLVIFIRPHILASLEDMQTITRNQEEIHRDNAGTPFLERNYDNGMEFIKTPDDE